MFWSCFKKGFGYVFGAMLALAIALIFALIGSAIAIHFSYVGGLF
jgi:hypothetical protein